MFANFTEETCTGTGLTLALAGATSGMVAFQESFSDGDLIEYTLEDSGGTILIAGIGVYVSATDDITRNDTWNWNGTAVDTSPVTNITLGGGTHTVRSSIVQQTAPIVIPKSAYGIMPSGVDTSFSSLYGAYLADNIYLVPFQLTASQSFTSIEMSVSAAAAGNTRLGVYSIGTDGYPLNLLVDSGAIDTSTTGIKSATIALDLTPGTYYFAMVSDSALDPVTGTGMTNIIGHSGTLVVSMVYKAQTYGALPAALSGSYSVQTSRPLYIAMD